jgi:hypothetical protein
MKHDRILTARTALGVCLRGVPPDARCFLGSGDQLAAIATEVTGMAPRLPRPGPT